MKKLLLFFIAALCSAGYVSAQCVASFIPTVNPKGNALLNVSFNNTSSYGLPFTGQLRTYTFHYGDGNIATNWSSNPAIPDHVYAAPGTYTAGLRIYSYDSVTSTMICTDSFGTTVTVAYPSCGSRIAVSGTGASRTFSASTPAGASGMSYAWSFGDGGTATGATPSHTYTTAGVYTVTLTATRTSPACSYTNTIQVYVSIPPPALNCGALSANVTGSLTGNVATFVNTSSTVSSPYVMEAQWDFGDGAYSNAINPANHTYSATGVYTVGLRMYWRDSFYSTVCTDSATVVLAVTSIPAPPNLISGEVRYDSLTYGINNFKVWLIKLDSASNTLYAVDSQVTANTANAYYAFANKPAGVYRTKAAVFISSSTGTGLIPTYHDSSVYWNTAAQIYHFGGSSTGRNIFMRSGTLSTGPGFIGGNVSLGANKGSANGVPGVTVYLRNAAARVVAMTITDNAGNYSFANVPLGAYSLYPEILNIATTPITPIVLSAGEERFTSGDFSYDETRRSIVPRAALSIPGCFAAPGMYITPNPAHDKLNITWSGSKDAERRFVITSATGQVVYRSEQVAGASGNVTLNVSNLAAGIYYVQAIGASAVAPARIVIQ